MRLTERGEVRRALILLGVPIAELSQIEGMRGTEAEAALEKFKERIAIAFRASVRSEHHPDHGSDPADSARRAANFRTIRAFSDSVKNWKIKPDAIQTVPAVDAIDLTMFGAAMAEMFRQFHEDMRRATEAAIENLNDFDPPPEVYVEPNRRRATFRSSPVGTEVESQSTRAGGRVHRVRKFWKT